MKSIFTSINPRVSFLKNEHYLSIIPQYTWIHNDNFFSFSEEFLAGGTEMGIKLRWRLQNPFACGIILKYLEWNIGFWSGMETHTHFLAEFAVGVLKKILRK